DRDGKSALYDETFGEIIRKDLNMCARWQERALRERSDRVVLFLDEPSLSLVGTPFAPIASHKVVEWIDEVLHGLSCIKGIHCCGNTDWSLLLATSVDILSFDTYEYAETLALYPDEVRAFLARGGLIAWGITPKTDVVWQETVASLAARLEEAIGLLARKGVPRDDILAASLVTPSCGVGTLDEPAAERALALTAGVAKVMRERYSGGN
ncbi:MAG: methionine synthase, partial [Anaerolineae bacterium]|nr:methionine synthase [Anaerolineae bacterium]